MHPHRCADAARYEEEQLALAARWSQPDRESIAALCRARQIALASHDDATRPRCRDPTTTWQRDRPEISTTFEAAEASRKHGMNVLMRRAKYRAWRLALQQCGGQ